MRTSKKMIERVVKYGTWVSGPYVYLHDAQCYRICRWRKDETIGENRAEHTVAYYDFTDKIWRAVK